MGNDLPTMGKGEENKEEEEEAKENPVTTTSTTIEPANTTESIGQVTTSPPLAYRDNDDDDDGNAQPEQSPPVLSDLQQAVEPKKKRGRSPPSGYQLLASVESDKELDEFRWEKGLVVNGQSRKHRRYYACRNYWRNERKCGYKVMAILEPSKGSWQLYSRNYHLFDCQQLLDFPPSARKSREGTTATQPSTSSHQLLAQQQKKPLRPKTYKNAKLLATIGANTESELNAKLKERMGLIKKDGRFSSRRLYYGCKNCRNVQWRKWRCYHRVVAICGSNSSSSSIAEGPSSSSGGGKTLKWRIYGSVSCSEHHPQCEFSKVGTSGGSSSSCAPVALHPEHSDRSGQSQQQRNSSPLVMPAKELSNEPHPSGGVLLLPTPEKLRYVGRFSTEEEFLRWRLKKKVNRAEGTTKTYRRFCCSNRTTYHCNYTVFALASGKEGGKEADGLYSQLQQQHGIDVWRRNRHYHLSQSRRKGRQKSGSLKKFKENNRRDRSTSANTSRHADIVERGESSGGSPSKGCTVEYYLANPSYHFVGSAINLAKIESLAKQHGCVHHREASGHRSIFHCATLGSNCPLRVVFVWDHKLGRYQTFAKGQHEGDHASPVVVPREVDRHSMEDIYRTEEEEKSRENSTYSTYSAYYDKEEDNYEWEEVVRERSTTHTANPPTAQRVVAMNRIDSPPPAQITTTAAAAVTNTARGSGQKAVEKKEEGGARKKGGRKGRSLSPLTAEEAAEVEAMLAEHEDSDYESTDTWFKVTDHREEMKQLAVELELCCYPAGKHVPCHTYCRRGPDPKHFVVVQDFPSRMEICRYVELGDSPTQQQLSLTNSETIHKRRVQWEEGLQRVRSSLVHHLTHGGQQ